ncbi:MAG TPA: hypothetical protein VGD48_33805 [Kutzneria sp.]
MLLAYHNLGQLPRELKDGIATNARTKILFTASDAQELSRLAWCPSAPLDRV